jgi:hypothetical protein
LQQERETKIEWEKDWHETVTPITGKRASLFEADRFYKTYRAFDVLNEGGHGELFPHSEKSATSSAFMSMTDKEMYDAFPLSCTGRRRDRESNDEFVEEIVAPKVFVIGWVVVLDLLIR